MIRKALIVKALLVVFVASLGAPLYAQKYRKAVEGPDNVKNKRYPKVKRFEIDLQAGGLLNQSYVRSIAFGGSIQYFWSERWGMSLDGMFYSNTDKAERTCIENFYNDFYNRIGNECAADGSKATAQAEIRAGDVVPKMPGGGVENPGPNIGPAYVPIRENTLTIGLNAIWAPIYGKQLMFLSQTNYFDVYFLFGGGIAMSEFYPKQAEDPQTGRKYRLTSNQPPDANPGDDIVEPAAGVDPSRTDAYGIDGRPQVQKESNVYINLGIGQKYHFGKKFHVKFELRNFTTLGFGESGISNNLKIVGGVGLRL
jgi:outer membrane beta-barrel protein